MLLNIITAVTIVTIFSIRTAAGEEIGWRGYMLTRLIDAGITVAKFNKWLNLECFGTYRLSGGVYI